VVIILVDGRLGSRPVPGGPELLVILAVMTVPVAIVVLVMALASRATVSGPSQPLTPTGDARRCLESIAGDIHRLGGHSVEWLSSDVVQVSWRHRSGWVFVVAILAFPLGLFALLFTTTSYGTITLQHGSPPTIRLGGELSRAAAGAAHARMTWPAPQIVDAPS
jgi:hypothetical protein